MTAQIETNDARSKIKDILREFAKAGQFESISIVLNEVDRNTREYLLRGLPAIILNHHLFTLGILNYNQIQKWQSYHKTWSDQIKANAIDATKLAAVINRLILSMKSFEQM